MTEEQLPPRFPAIFLPDEEEGTQERARMNDIYDKLAKRADEGKVEIHPVTVLIAIVAESQDEAQAALLN